MKKICFTLVTLFLLVTIPSSIVQAGEIPPYQASPISYMDFVYSIDKGIGEDENGYYIKDTSFISTYIDSHYLKLKQLETFKSYTKLDIYKHVEITIEKSNLTYKKRKIETINKLSPAKIQTLGVPSGYIYWKPNHYTKNTWWGISHWMGTKTAIVSYGNLLIKASYAGGAITALAALAGGLPAAVTGLTSGYLGYLGTDLLDQSLYYNALYLDIPSTFIPYRFYQ